MIRPIALGLAGFSALVAMASVAAATGTGPAIAYLKDGGRQGREVYLVNPDGTGLTRLHVARGIEQIALRPGGGELALSFGGTIRIIGFDERGQPTTTREIKGQILVGDMDYRADGTLLYNIASGPQQVRLLPSGAAQSSLLFTVAGNITGLRWMRDGESVIFTQDDVVKKRDPAGTVTTLASPGYFPAHFGMRRTDDRAIVTDWYKSSTIDLTTGALSPTCKPMSLVRFSDTDVEMVYRTPAGPINGSYLIVQKSDCSGGTFRLGGRGGYLDVDWRR